jgi:predicted subunit of tRNA(5-methylaminomethyl-2-thiouridylate) methyltransferase
MGDAKAFKNSLKELEVMEVGLLYSGGKDSSLAAYLLDKMGLRVRLITATFGVNDHYKFAEESARTLGFDFELLHLDKNVLREAEEIVRRDDFPRYAFTHIHKKALESASKRYGVLSDGTRRDDKSPYLSLTDYRALEDGFGVEYLPVLRGFGHKTIDRLCSELFLFVEGESSKINKGDYEGELRTFLKQRGFNVEENFPTHTQTRVTSWRS